MSSLRWPQNIQGRNTLSTSYVQSSRWALINLTWLKTCNSLFHENGILKLRDCKMLPQVI